MKDIILGNMITVVALVFATLNGTRKNKRDMIACDLGATICFTLSNMVLKGYSGAVQNAVGVVRNISALYVKQVDKISWIFVVAGVILGVYFNNKGFVGLLPVITAAWYSYCALDKKSSAKRLKSAFIINNFAFMIYSAVIFNYVGVASNFIMNVMALVSYYKEYGFVFGKK